jgi:hypothetical protein
MATFDDGQSEWRGEIAFPAGYQGCEPPDGGIVLKDITHQQYHFARDVRVVGFWITYVKTDKVGGAIQSKPESRFYTLERASFDFQCVEKLAGADLDLKKQDFTKPADTKEYFLSTLRHFSHFPFTYAIRAIYKSKATFFPANCDMRSLTINQSYLFTAYSALPAHEPTGGLTAARFFPQVNTQFFASVTFNASVYPQYEVKSIRFDTRMHLTLDTFVDTPAVPTKPITAPDNFAGTFKDRETIANVPGRAAQTIFEATEKPLIYEIAAKGFLHSTNKLTDKTTWDNIHWWGARWETEKHLIGPPTQSRLHVSAPGAFFAVHFHWRWGGAARDTHRLLPNTAHRTAPQFKGTITDSSPLIDPGIPDQDLQFAVTSYDTASDPDKAPAKNLSTEDFPKFFTSKTATDISNGGNLVLWVGTTFNRTGGSALSGTHLVHGFFFAHNPEPGFVSKSGSKSAEYFPTDEKAIRALSGATRWERY